MLSLIRNTAEMNCLEEFENTAAFSRKYQAAQDCMCDTEHMFYCPDMGGDPDSEEVVGGFDDMEFNRFLQRTLQVSARNHWKDRLFTRRL